MSSNSVSKSISEWKPKYIHLSIDSGNSEHIWLSATDWLEYIHAYIIARDSLYTEYLHYAAYFETLDEADRASELRPQYRSVPAIFMVYHVIELQLKGLMIFAQDFAFDKINTPTEERAYSIKTVHSLRKVYDNCIEVLSENNQIHAMNELRNGEMIISELAQLDAKGSYSLLRYPFSFQCDNSFNSTVLIFDRDRMKDLMVEFDEIFHKTFSQLFVNAGFPPSRE